MLLEIAAGVSLGIVAAVLDVIIAQALEKQGIKRVPITAVTPTAPGGGRAQ